MGSGRQTCRVNLSGSLLIITIITKIKDMMKYSLVVILAVFSIGVQGARVERQAGDCSEVMVKFQACTTKAHEDYQTDFQAGDDGKPNWVARKSCNFLTAAVDGCGNLLGQCMPVDVVNNQKDNQIKQILHQLESQVTGWNSGLCPVVKAYNDRLAAAGGAPQTAAMEGATVPEPETEPEPSHEPEPSTAPEPSAGPSTPEPEPKGSSSSLAASISILVVCLALF